MTSHIGGTMANNDHATGIAHTIELIRQATELLSTIAALFSTNGADDTGPGDSGPGGGGRGPGGGGAGPGGGGSGSNSVRNHGLTATAALQLMPALKELETARRGLAAMDLKVAAVAVDGEMARILGTTRPDDYLSSEFRLTRKEAKYRIDSAAFLREHPELADRTAEVFASGDITFGALSRTRSEIAELHVDCPQSPTDVAGEVLQRAAACGPHGAGTLARKLVREANRPFPRDPAAANRKRRLNVGKQDRDGGTTVTAYLDAATTALLESWLLTHGLKKGSHDDGRTPAQRNADALDLALRTAHESTPRVPGKPMCTVVVALTADAARTATGATDPAIHPTRVTARSGAGVELGLADLLRLGLGDDTYLSVVDPEAPITDAKLRLGRTKRSATLDQHIALQLLDGTCQHPGCNRPPDACDRHHIVSWLRGGRTDVDNLTLLCRRHHSDNDDSLANPARGHMTPRTRHPRGRTGWAEPVRPDGTRRVSYNNSYRAQEAPGWAAA